MLIGVAAHAEDRPQRVSSLDLCVDEMLLTLADPEQIASLSPLARDPALSRVAAAAKAYPSNLASAEEIVHEKVDLVIAVDFIDLSTQAMLRRLGVRVETIPLVERLDQVAPVFRRVAALLGVPDRAEAALARMDERLDRLRAPAGARGSILIYEASGWTDGSATMWDDLMTLAGYANQATRLGRTGYGPLALETVVRDPPRYLVTQRYRGGGASLAQAWLDHPALRRLPSERVALSTHLYCGTPDIAAAVEDLVATTEGAR